MVKTKVNELSDDDLFARIASLCAEGCALTAEIVAYLVEVEERRLHLRIACSSMLDFCMRKLNMSKGNGFRYLTAARLVPKYPCLLPAIACGALRLSTLVELRDHLTTTNAEELLVLVRGKSFCAVKELLAAGCPKPDVMSTIVVQSEQYILASSPAEVSRRAMSPSWVEPLSPVRFTVTMTVSRETRDKLERARDLMRHRNPGNDIAVVFDRALDGLLPRLEKERLGAAKRPRCSGPAVRGGSVSRGARRDVFARDGEQCTYEDAQGSRCPARGFLELDHIEARALGGAGDAANLRVLCRAHNRLHAEEVFGRDHVERAIAHRRGRSSLSKEGDETTAPAFDGGTRATCPNGEERGRDRARALAGLLGLGFKGAEASRALDTVLTRRADATLPDVLRETIGLLT